MNEDRRKQINGALDKLREGLADLESARDDEQEYFDNMPESLQTGEKGEKAEGAVSQLEDAISEIESAISTAEEALD